MIKFTVNRSTWRRGSLGQGTPQLLNPEGYSCCLGFLAAALGIPKAEIVGTAPAVQACHAHKIGEDNVWPEALVRRSKPHLTQPYVCTELCDDIIGCNDSKIRTEEEREQRLTELFTKADIEVRFED